MSNILKTLFLLGILSVLLITIGAFIGGREGLIMAFGFSLILNVGAYFFSEKIALSASGAKPLIRTEHPDVYQTVEELSRRMNIPMPKLYITPAAQANAFATGRSPSHASVAVTEGILKVLTPTELKGVLAHELAHVKNRDILISSIAAVLASSISFVSNMAIFGGLNSDEDNRGAGIAGLVLALLVPIAATMVQFAVSRSREFAADETGAKTIGSGTELAKALVAIHDSTRHDPLRTNPAFSSLYISNPLGGLGSAMNNLFSTHPPVEERVRRLKSLR